LETLDNEKDLDGTNQKSLSPHGGAILRELYALSGQEILDRILEQDSPRQMVQQLTQEDFFWLIKKVGNEDCLTLLELASEDQWQYLMDVELWRKDHLHLEETYKWLKRLQQADIKGLVRWLFGEGQSLAYFYFFKSIQVEIRGEDTAYDIKTGFFTLDGVFYVRVIDKDHRETIEDILRKMADEDLGRYQAFLFGLGGVIPAEIEEGMFRLRNVRLAEHGFVPWDEALSVYAPLAPGSLSVEGPIKTVNFPLDEQTRALIPLSPLYHAQGRNLLTEAFSRISDDLFLDRIRLEFAGLCNQILSADGVLANEYDVLIKTCRKAAGYVNLALERLCGMDISRAEKILRGNFLVSVFRAGFGLALEIKWEAERWLKESWFYGRGMDFSFWGDDWGETLAGIVKKKPRLYIGFEEGERYKDFEQLSELNACRKLLHRLMFMDKMLERLLERYPLDESIIQDHRPFFSTPGLGSY
jgi:hypothetical protein